MKKALTLILCLGAVMLGQVSAAANDKRANIITEDRNASDFSGISTSAGIDVYVTQGDNYSVKVKTDRDIMKYVITRVDNGVLRVEYSNNLKNNRRRNIQTVVYVTLPKITTLSASSGADIKVGGVITGNSLTVSASSSGEVKAMIEYDKVVISSSSGADVELKGKVNICTASASSGADIDISDLECHTAVVEASSGADIEVYATDTLTASASSGASIEYHGNPRVVTKNASSGGSVRQDR